MKSHAGMERMAKDSSELIHDLDFTAIAEIGRLLASGVLSCDSTIADLSDVLSLPKPKLKMLKKLLDSTKGSAETSSSEWLGMSFLALAKHKEQTQSQSGNPEIVASGEDWIPGARDTRNVILEMIRSARTEILMVVYTATGGAKEIVNELSKKTTEGVNIILLADTEMDVTDSILRMWPSGVARPPVFIERPGAAARKIHGKVVVVDRHDLLVTSANLTHLGLDVNLEIGIRVQGRSAERIAQGIIALCASGSLVQAA